MTTNQPKELIFLGTLAKTHDNIPNRRHRLIIQDLFYLCTNDSFIESILDIRRKIVDKLVELGEESPILPTDLPKIVRKYRKVIYDANLWNWYRMELMSIADIHDYYGQCFLDDYLTELITENEDYKLTLSDFEDLNILENIIFFNNPIWSEDDNLKVPFRSRAGHLSIDYSIYGAYIKGEFDLGTEKQTIVRIIHKDFNTVAELQEKEYRIPNTRREVEDQLSTKCRIFEMEKQNKTLVQIAIALEAQSPNEEVSVDKVRLLQNRIKQKNTRFDK